ncbi:UNKNOWN [Stylonychia lemnae]|uniref:Uncharacterized protein n=1 Tax=Stylonychia lemnae TaxID=5949 RepID=A0A077ZTH9_STYLE|nr:UNKNOWN [Stylonychia lemnae]|eukprot:CDW72640.1 UNKNOWN [Stylonychia lemnae]
MATLDVYFDIVGRYEEIKIGLSYEESYLTNDDLRKLREKKHGCYVILINLFTYDIQYYSREEQCQLFKSIKSKIMSRLTSISYSGHLAKIIEPLFEIEKYSNDDENFDSDSDLDSSDNSDSESKKKKKDDQEEVNSDKIKKQEEKKKQEEQKAADRLLPQAKAFFGENQLEYLKSKLTGVNILEMTSVSDRVEFIFACHALSEIFLNNHTTDEPSLIFIRENYEKFNETLLQIFDIAKTKFLELSKDDQQYIMLLGNTVAYLFLDLFLNQVNPDLISEDGILIETDSALTTLKMSLEFNEFLLSQEVQSHPILIHLFDQMGQFTCKLVTYSASYIAMTIPSQHEDIIRKGCADIIKMIQCIIKPFQDSKERLNLYRHKQDLVFDIFDSLNQIFNNADISLIEPLLTDELFSAILFIFNLDHREQKLLEKSNETTEFFQLQNGASRRYYKEFAFAFVNDIIKHPKAIIKFLSYYVQVFNQNRKGNQEEREKATAALFVLSLCDSQLLENEKLLIANFCKSQLIDLVLNQQEDQLMRFRAIWILETYVSFLDKSDIMTLMLYYGKVFTQSQEKVEEDKLIISAMAMAIFKYISESDQQMDKEGGQLTDQQIQENLKMTPQQLLELFIDYSYKYPELFEFPNGIQNMMILFEEQVKFDVALIDNSLETLIRGFNVVVAKATLQDDQGQSEDDDEYLEYMQTISEIVDRATFLSILDESKVDQLKVIIKKHFNQFALGGLHNPGKRLMSVMKSFYMFFTTNQVQFNFEEPTTEQQKKNTKLNESSSESEDEQEEEKKQYEDENNNGNKSIANTGPPSDTEVIRILLLNTIYTFNSAEKVKLMQDKASQYVAADDGDSSNENKSLESESHTSSSGEFESDNNFQVTLTALDDDCYTIHFILYQTKCQIKDLFKGVANLNNVSDIYEPLVQNAIQNIMRLFTIGLQTQIDHKFVNKISYWMVMNTLIENDYLTEVDEQYLSQLEDGQEPFYLFEKSLELLAFSINLQKTQEVAYLFYFYELALYYSYQNDTVIEQMLKIQPADLNLFLKEFTFYQEQSIFLVDGRKYLIENFKGYYWLVRALMILSQIDQYKAQIDSFILRNLKTFSMLTRIISDQLYLKKPFPQLDAVNQNLINQKLALDIKNLQTLLDTEEFDDFTEQGLIFYYSSHQTQIGPEDYIEDFIGLYEMIKDYPIAKENALNQNDKVTISQKFKEMISFLKQQKAIYEDKEESDDDKEDGNDKVDEIDDDDNDD